MNILLAHCRGICALALSLLHIAAAPSLAQPQTLTITNARFFNGISRDGNFVVGQIQTHGGGIAAMWTRAAGLVQLPLPGGYINSSARAVSNNGRAVGWLSSPGLVPQPANYWDGVTTPVVLGDLPGGALSASAAGISADGTVIVCEGRAAEGPLAWIWTQTGGMEALGDFTGGVTTSLGTGVSADGTVVIGYGTSAFGEEAFRWTRQTGLQPLVPPGTDPPSHPYAISADALTIVGDHRRSSHTTPFVWRQRCGMVDVPLPIGYSIGVLKAVNGTGTVAGGYCVGTTDSAMIWDPLHGARLLIDILRDDLGLSLGSFRPSAITGISDDGTVIVGNGRTATDWASFVLILPHPCSADMNSDGGVDGSDIDAFFAAWQASELAADLNGDGGCDGVDIEAFFSIWSNGC